MTTPEERRLADLLRSEADLLEPTGGLDRIRSGVSRRRARRRAVVSGAAGAVVVAVASVLVLTSGAGTTSLRPAPQASAPTSTPTSAPLTGDADGSTTSAPGTPVFPFTDDAQAAAWARDAGARPWASDPVAVAQHLVDDLLGLEDLTAVGERDGTPIELRGTDGLVATVSIAQLGTGAQRPWVVLAVTSAGGGGGPLRVTSPLDGQAVRSPLTVAGSVPGVDENVAVTLRTSAGTLLAKGTSPAGSEAPWSVPLAWRTEEWPAAALTAVTRSLRDGTVTRLALVVVVPDTSTPSGPAVPPAGDAFVGEVDGVVGLYSATDGRWLSQVSYPTAGSLDVGPVLSGSVVHWMRLGRECADRRIIRRDLATGATTTVLSDEPLLPGTLAVSPDGRTLVWGTQPGCEQPGKVTVHVAGPGGTREATLFEDLGLNDTAVADDGTVVLEVVGQDGGAVQVLPAGGGELVTLQPRDGCVVFNPGLLSGRVIALELCGGPDSEVFDPPARTEWSYTGQRLLTKPMSIGSVDRLAVVRSADGDRVLVQQQDGTIGRLVDTRLEVIRRQPACAETLESRGCLTGIDW